jgi:phosphoribosylaminoimidazole-succinocarboxamide synthase
MQDKIQSALGSTVDKIEFPQALSYHSGKVRESFTLPNEQRAIVVSDRISAFDFILGTIPFKGQVLNRIAAWWFEKLDGVVNHHFISTPDPNISLVKNAKVLPVEIIVRGYLTGTTKTSSWYSYQNLNRMICGIEMPEGMKKNQKFEAPIITPTTKPTEPGAHDAPITKEEIVAQGLVTAQMYEQVEEYAMKMFTLGQKVAAERGLILVDTKYEMGIDSEGNLMVIDEVHTPDSSRYWIANSYEERFNNDEEPDMLDKEFVRRMIVGAGYDVNDLEKNPADFMTDELRMAAAEKYIQLFEKVTGEAFEFPEELNAKVRIEESLQSLLK